MPVFASYIFRISPLNIKMALFKIGFLLVFITRRLKKPLLKKLEEKNSLVS